MSLPQILGVVSYILAALGVAFCWWLPLGMLFSLAGLTSGFVGWLNARRPMAMLLCGGMFIAAVAFGIDLLAVWLNVVTVRFGALQ